MSDPTVSTSIERIAEADGWGTVDPASVLAAVAEAIAWALIEQTMDTSDREVSDETLRDARATAARIMRGDAERPDAALAAEEQTLAARVEALVEEWLARPGLGPAAVKRECARRLRALLPTAPGAGEDER